MNKRTPFTTSDLLTPILAVAVTGVVMLFCAEAFAQTGTPSLSGTQQNIASNIVSVPRFVAVLAYVIGTFFVATGLVKLKDWINDSNKNSLNPAIFRIVVASLLYVFPHVLVMINTSLFGSQKGGSTQNVTEDDCVLMRSLNAFQSSNQQQQPCRK